ncbi:DUF4410 domain-containing protein [Cerasicoccus frondis]|uniref:DUF4410 domain-containing protein n=1 Tax=Cerasicoccus frondis TaxID=490090 RepID=UPI00285265BC|nr:DUF4410 domain-containing protein [Cerasicoccus frondis]
MIKSPSKLNQSLTALAIALILSGCASTAPSANFSKAIAEEEVVDANDSVKLKIQAQRGVSVAHDDLNRLAIRIGERIDVERNELGVVNDPRKIEVVVLITRYEKGDAMARAILAGTGQIHIDARVVVKNSATGELIGDFEIDKTFAWGGIYGATTSIEDVEEGFADGVAKAVAESSNS